LPFSKNPKTGKVMYGRDKEAGFLPMNLDLGNALPYSQALMPQGSLNIPSMFMPGGPGASIFQALSSEYDPYTGRQIYQKDDPNAKAQAMKYLAMKNIPALYAAGRLNDAAEGVPARIGTAPESIPEALNNIINPIKVRTTDLAMDQVQKEKSKQAVQMNVKRLQSPLKNKMESVYGSQGSKPDPAKAEKLQVEQDKIELNNMKRFYEIHYNSTIRDPQSEVGQKYQEISQQLAEKSGQLAGAKAGAQKVLRDNPSVTDIYHNVVDGDTVDVRDPWGKMIRIRFSEIDAPEHDQEYGQKAKRFLDGLTSGKHVVIETAKLDKHGRSVSKIMVEGKDVAETLIKYGMAWQYTRYSDDSHLAELQKNAQDKKIGLWAGLAPIEPEKWRHQK
jgi:micrococcal nuclease